MLGDEACKGINRIIEYGINCCIRDICETVYLFVVATKMIVIIYIVS